MSPNLIRILIAGALFVHGVGHSLGFFMPAHSWLFPKVGEPFTRIVASIFWALATVGFLLSLLGFLGFIVPSEWWRPLAIVFAIISLVGLILFWSTWPQFNAIAAFATNLVILVSLLWLKWPPMELFGK